MKISEKLKTRINELWKNPPILNLGKNGVNDQFINEFKKQIKRKKIIKIKILKSALDSEDKNKIISDIEAKGDANCLEIRGNHVIFLKKNEIIE